jgi:nitronate monooxygenase
VNDHSYSNKFYEDAVKHHLPVARYPVQQAATNPIKAKSSSNGEVGMGSMWCGQNPTLARAVPVDTLIRDVMSEANSLVQMDY